MSNDKHLMQQIQEDIEALNRKISQAIHEKRTDGDVRRTTRIMKAAASLQQGVMKLADLNGMMVDEIVLAMNTEDMKVLAALDLPFDYTLRVGAIVESKDPDGDPLRAGFGVYEAAIVVSVEPLVLVSKQADMRWSTWTSDRVQVVGTASPARLEKAMTRLAE